MLKIFYLPVQLIIRFFLQDFFFIWQKEEYRVAKTLLWMFGVSHLLLVMWYNIQCMFEYEWIAPQVRLWVISHFYNFNVYNSYQDFSLTYFSSNLNPNWIIKIYLNQIFSISRFPPFVWHLDHIIIFYFDHD